MSIHVAVLSNQSGKSTGGRVGFGDRVNPLMIAKIQAPTKKSPIQDSQGGMYPANSIPAKIINIARQVMQPIKVMRLMMRLILFRD